MIDVIECVYVFGGSATLFGDFRHGIMVNDSMYHVCLVYALIIETIYTLLVHTCVCVRV